jgi:hypothetical protein
MQSAFSQSSIDRYGRYEYKRTDLGLETDTLAATWAQYVATLYAYPQITLGDVVALPAIDEKSWQAWAATLGIDLVSDLVRVVWAPPDHPEHVIDSTSRVVGFAHEIHVDRWEVTLELIAASSLMFSGSVFTMGPDAQDRLDTGFVLGFTATGGP